MYWGFYDLIRSYIYIEYTSLHQFLCDDFNMHEMNAIELDNLNIFWDTHNIVVPKNSYKL